MAAQTANLSLLRFRVANPSVLGFLRCLVWTISTSLAIVAVILLLRRGLGGLVRPLDVVSFLITGITLATLLGVARWMTWAMVERLSSTERCVLWGLPGAAVLLIAVGVSLPSSSLWGLFFFWSPLLLEEGVFISRLVHWLPSGWRPRNSSIEPTHIKEEPGSAHSPLLPVGDWWTGDMPGEVFQQIMLARDETGREFYYGRLRVEFAAGQRVTSLHIGFCPPLEFSPDLVVEQIAGPEVHVKSSQVLPYGARLEVKLKTLGQEPSDAVLEFFTQHVATAGPSAT